MVVPGGLVVDLAVNAVVGASVVLVFLAEKRLLVVVKAASDFTVVPSSPGVAVMSMNDPQSRIKSRLKYRTPAIVTATRRSPSNTKH